MKVVFWVLAIVAVIFTVDFVMTNGQPVTFGSWLLPWQIDVPVGLAVLCAFAIGLIIGGFLAWGTSGRLRRRARTAERRVETLERELGGLVRRAENAEREAMSVALPAPAKPDAPAEPAPPAAAAGRR